MNINKNHSIGIVLVLSAGLFWSTSGILYRLIQDATPWHVLFYRSIALFLPILFWLIFRYRRAFFKKLTDGGKVSLIGGFSAATAFLGYLVALEFTSVANAMLLLATAPFFALILGSIVLSETITKPMLGAMMIAAIGVAIMAGDEISLGRGFGEVFAILSALGFAGLTVSLRAIKGQDNIFIILIATIIATIYASVGLVLSDLTFKVLLVDLLNCFTMGWFQLGIGFVLYTAGAKYLKSGELTLLSMTEVIAGPIIVWVVISEVPANSTLIGAGFILASIIATSMIKLNNSDIVYENRIAPNN